MTTCHCFSNQLLCYLQLHKTYWFCHQSWQKNFNLRWSANKNILYLKRKSRSLAIKLLGNKNKYETIRESRFANCNLANNYVSKTEPSMHNQKNYLHKILDFMVLTTYILSLTIGIDQTALAGYQPPKDQKPPRGHSDSSGVRVTRSAVSFAILLPPIDNVKITTSPHPVK